MWKHCSDSQLARFVVVRLKICGDPFVSRCGFTLTCFVGPWLNVLESCALSQNTKFAMALLTVEFICLTVGNVLMKRRGTKFRYDVCV